VEAATTSQARYTALEAAIDALGPTLLDLRDELAEARRLEEQQTLVGQLRDRAVAATEHRDALLRARAEASTMLERQVEAMVAEHAALVDVRRDFTRIINDEADARLALRQLRADGLDLAALLAPWAGSGETPHDRSYLMPAVEPYGNLVTQLYAEVLGRGTAAAMEQDRRREAKLRQERIEQGQQQRAQIVQAQVEHMKPARQKEAELNQRQRAGRETGRR